MKKLIYNLKSISFNNLWIIPFTFILTWIVFLCILDSRTTPFNPLLLLTFILLFSFLLCFTYKKLNRKFNKLSNKVTFIFYTISSIIMVFLQFYIGYKTRTNPTWDLGIAINAAKEINLYGHMTESAAYFTNFPNNILNALILALCFKFFSILGITSGNGPMLVLNILVMQFSLFLMFQITRKLFNNFTSCYTYILSMLFIPFYPYSSICYTDTLSMFIPLSFIYVFMKIKDHENIFSKVWFYYILIGILCFLALRIKITALIIFIAILLVLFFSMKLFTKNFKTLIIGLIIATICFVGINQFYKFVINKTKVINVKYSQTGLIPYTHWIMMGTYGQGAFSSSEYDYTFSFKDYNSRKKANIKKVKERLKQWKTQGYIKFLNNKISTQTWGDGTYDFASITSSNVREKNYMHEFFLADGKYYTQMYYYCQTYHFSMLILIIISLIYYMFKEEKIELKAMKLSMFGLLIFLLIWETRSRYMLNYIPIYIILFVSGINVVSKNLTRILCMLFLKNNKAK